MVGAFCIPACLSSAVLPVLRRSVLSTRGQQTTTTCFLCCLPLPRTHCDEGDSFTEPYIAGHNVLNSHARAVSTYRTKYKAEQRGIIGMTLNCDWAKVSEMIDDDDDKDDFVGDVDAVTGGIFSVTKDKLSLPTPAVSCCVFQVLLSL